MARGNLAAVRGAAGACKEAARGAAARRGKSPTSEFAVRLDLEISRDGDRRKYFSAGFDASPKGLPSVAARQGRRRAKRGERSKGAAGAAAQPATPEEQPGIVRNSQRERA